MHFQRKYLGQSLGSKKVENDLQVCLNDAFNKNDLDNKIMTSTEKKFTEPLNGNTYRKGIRHLKRRNKDV